MSKAIYAGSFGPFHYGHLNIVRQAACIFDKVYVAVAQNATKNDYHSRAGAIASDILSTKLENVEVVELPKDQFLADLATYLGCKVLVRGLRDVTDAASEIKNSYITTDLSNGRLLTVFLASSYRDIHVSSSMLRSFVGLNGWEDRLRDYMPLHCRTDFIKKMKGKS